LKEAGILENVGATAAFTLEEFVFWAKEMFSIYSEMLAVAIS